MDTNDAPPVRTKVRKSRFQKVMSEEPAPEAPVETPQDEDRPEMRSEMRPAPREEDPRARAARRAAELRNHLGSLDEGTDDFYIPKHLIPPGWAYEWKRKTVLGAEDPAYQVALARAGWEPVPAKRHPEMMPDKGNYAVIERKGMILMERPQEISDEARHIELMKAKNQVRQKEAQLNSAPDGQFSRDHAQVKPKINKSYEAMKIPE